MDYDPPLSNIDIIRSTRRTRTVSARLVDGRIVVRVPAGLTPEYEQQLVEDVVAKVQKKNYSTAITDDHLMQRAQELNAEYLDHRARWRSIRWVTNQHHRWGSCSPASGEIRISHRLHDVPDYVLDSVIIHELVHTFITDGHSAEFWTWANKAPHSQRARGFLEAWSRITTDPA